MGGGGAHRQGVFVEMMDDAVNDFWVGKNRDDLHFRATFAAQEWVHLEDFSDQACPIGPAGSGCRRGFLVRFLSTGWKACGQRVL